MRQILTALSGGAGSAVELIADGMVTLSPDVFASVFEYIYTDTAVQSAASIADIESAVGAQLAAFGDQYTDQNHPYYKIAEYVREHTAEFAAAIVDYSARLAPDYSSISSITPQMVVAGAEIAFNNASTSAIEAQLCEALGYSSLNELFAALTGEDTAEIYKALTQTLSSVIDSDLIGTLIQAQNISLPAGSYTENGITYIVNVDGSISTLQDLIFMPATGINLLSLLTSSWGEADGILSFLVSLLPAEDGTSPLEETVVQEFLIALINGNISAFTDGQWTELGEILGIDSQLLSQWAANVYIDKDGEFTALLREAGFISLDSVTGNYSFNGEAVQAFADELGEFTLSLSLNDIADITVIDTSAMVYSKLDGVNSITLSVTKQAGYSGATLSDDLNALLTSLTQEEGFAANIPTN